MIPYRFHVDDLLISFIIILVNCIHNSKSSQHLNINDSLIQHAFGVEPIKLTQQNINQNVHHNKLLNKMLNHLENRAHNPIRIRDDYDEDKYDNYQYSDDDNTNSNDDDESYENESEQEYDDYENQAVESDSQLNIDQESPRKIKRFKKSRRKNIGEKQQNQVAPQASKNPGM